MKPMNLRLATCFLFAGFGLPGFASEQGQTAGPTAGPTDQQLDAWRAHFQPGLYRVVEFPLDHKLEPIVKSTKTREACVSTLEMDMIASMPASTPMLWQCDAQRLDFKDLSMSVFMACKRDGVVLAGNAVLQVSSDGKFIQSMLALVDPAKKGPKSLKYGAGTQMERIGDCTK